MAKSRLIQSNFTTGEIAPTLRARIDIEKYYNGCTKAENVVILPHGGLKRRPGLAKTADTHQPDAIRIESFEFSVTQEYLILFEPSAIKIFKDGALQSTEVSPYTTAEVIKDLDVIQSADTMIIVHEDFAPRQLQRQGSDTNWAVSIIALTNVPTYDFGAGAEPVWSATRGWPRTATFHGGRLWFGGSKQKINSIWGSVVNVFFDFNVGTGLADDAIFDTLDTDQYNAIQGIYSGRHLQVFTSGGEFYNSSSVIAPTTSSWKRQTAYGSIRERPISVDGATLFVDRSTRTVRQFIWSFNEDSYISTNITLISSHIVNNIQAIAAIRGSDTDVSDFVYVVNGDGTVAVMNTMRLEQIQGWTRWTTDGLFKDITVVGKTVYFIVERDGINFVEYLREGTYTDHNVAVFGTRPTTDNIVHLGDNIINGGGSNILHTDLTTGTLISEVDTDYIDALTTREFKVVTDNSIQADSLVTVLGVNDNKMVLPRDAYSAEVGIAYNVSIKTLPLNVGTQADGQIVNLQKRVNRVILNLHESLGVYVESEFLGDKVFPVILNEAAEPFTGIKEIYLFGYINRLVEVEVSQTDALPFTLLSIDSEIEG